MSVAVTASFTEASRDIQHVPVKLRQCLFYDESSYLLFYTHSDCMLKCRMLFLLQNCNCTPFNMPRMVDARTCDMRDVACLRIYYGGYLYLDLIINNFVSNYIQSFFDFISSPYVTHPRFKRLYLINS